MCDFLDQIALVAPDNRDKIEAARAQFETRVAKNDILFNLPAELSSSFLLPYLETDAETGQVTAECLKNPSVNKYCHQIRSMFGDAASDQPWDIPAFWGALPPEIQNVVLRYLTLFKNHLELYKQAKKQFGASASTQSQTPDLAGLMGPIIKNIQTVMSEVNLSDFKDAQSFGDVLQNPKIRSVLDKVLGQTGGAMPDQAITDLLARGPLANVGSDGDGLSALLNNLMPSMAAMFAGGDDSGASTSSAGDTDPYITMMGHSSQVADMIKQFGSMFGGRGRATPTPAPVAAPTAVPEEEFSTPVPSVAVSTVSTPVAPPAQAQSLDLDFSDCVSSVQRK